MQDKSSHEEMQEIRNALLALGYKKESRVLITPTAPGHVRVAVDGIAIGIYDLARHTFVD